MAITRAFTVDVLEVSDLLGDGARGRLGMCRLPGLDPTSLAADVAAIARLRPSVVVTLLGIDELHGHPGLMDRARGFLPTMGAAGFRHRHHPIANGGVPPSLPDFVDLVDELCVELAGGRTIVLHCVAGLGRTGLTAAACLVRLGVAADRAMESVRRVRPGTIEDRSQEAYVRYFSAKIGRSSRR